MTSKSLPLAGAIVLWDRVMHFEQSLSQTAARALLKLLFPPRDVARMEDHTTAPGHIASRTSGRMLQILRRTGEEFES